MMDINLHDCTDIRVVRYYPDNANSIGIEIPTFCELTRQKGMVSITLYDLPQGVVDRLLQAFPAKETIPSARNVELFDEKDQA